MTEIGIDTFTVSNLNLGTSIIYLSVGFVIFSILTAYPFEFWRKTPYLFGNILAIYLFQNIMLCPNEGNGYASCLDPENNPVTLYSYSYLALFVYIFLFFSFVNLIAFI